MLTESSPNRRGFCIYKNDTETKSPQLEYEFVCIENLDAFVLAMTFFPFILNSSITTLTLLDFHGFVISAGSASIAELFAQGKENLHAPWLGISSFVTLSLMLSVLIFIGEAARDAFDPRLEGARWKREIY